VRYLWRGLAILRPLQQQQARQVLDEDQSDPLGHAMRARRFERPVERDDGVDDAADVHQDGEHEVLGKQRKIDRRRWKKTGDEYLQHRCIEA